LEEYEYGKKATKYAACVMHGAALLPVVAGAVGSETPNQETDKISVNHQ
jgi:hypothetical protein